MTIPNDSELAAAEAAITSRRSIRAFLPTPVPRSTDRANPRRRLARAVRDEHAAVEGLRPHRRAAAVAVAPSRRRVRRPRGARTPQRGIRVLPDRVDLALHRPAPQGRLGPLRRCSASPRPTRRGCTPSIGATIEFFGAPVGLMFTIDRIMQPGQLARLRHVPRRRDGRGARPWPRHLPAGRVHAVSPHRRRRDRRARRASSLSAACRSATPTPMRSRTRSSPSASRSQPLPAFSGTKDCRSEPTGRVGRDRYVAHAAARTIGA